MSAAFRRAYGAGPGHLLGHLALLGLVAYVVLRVVDAPLAVRTGVWFVGAAVLHDALVVPLYVLADRALQRVTGRRALNHVRVPVALSLLLLVVFFPLISGHSEPTIRFVSATGADGYLLTWALLSAGMLAVSALLYAASVLRGSRTPA